MKPLLHGTVILAIAGLPLGSDVPVWAQSADRPPLPRGTRPRPTASAHDAALGARFRPAPQTDDAPQCGRRCSQPCGLGCCPICGFAYADPGFYAGAEYLLIRPHFSEAIAFARGTQTTTGFETQGRELQFDYDSSFRIVGGYRRGYGEGELRFTYWHFGGEISVDGTAEAGGFLVDPFGNLVGTVVVIDPHSRLYGTALTGGDLIRTRATVETNVYDLDFIRPLLLAGPNWVFRWSAGVRIADIDQFYESVITAAGAPFSAGDFAVDFIGAGPRFGLDARRHFGAEGRICAFANSHAALLLGEDTIASSNAPNPVFRARQSESLTRTIPVLETELGLSWQIRDSLNLSAGWLFQAWFDLGTSGGQFGGLFAGADDSNIMSFDGMFLKGLWTF